MIAGTALEKGLIHINDVLKTTYGLISAVSPAPTALSPATSDMSLVAGDAVKTTGDGSQTTSDAAGATGDAVGMKRDTAPSKSDNGDGKSYAVKMTGDKHLFTQANNPKGTLQQPLNRALKSTVRCSLAIR